MLIMYKSVYIYHTVVVCVRYCMQNYEVNTYIHVNN